MKRLDARARHSASVVLLVVLVLFLLAAWVATVNGLEPLDRGTRSMIRDGRPLGLARPMWILGFVASGYVLFPITVVCSVVLWRRRQHALALWLPAIGVATAVALAVTKWLIHKPRPTLRGYGFPSGHVFGATVFVLVALYLLWRLEAPHRSQQLARVAGVAFVTGVGYSRIYVNAHWLSDVVGGLLAGVAFALMVVLALDARAR